MTRRYWAEIDGERIYRASLAAIQRIAQDTADKLGRVVRVGYDDRPAARRNPTPAPGYYVNAGSKELGPFETREEAAAAGLATWPKAKLIETSRNRYFDIRTARTPGVGAMIHAGLRRNPAAAERTTRRNGKWAKVSGRAGRWHVAAGWAGQVKAVHVRTWPTRAGANLAAAHWLDDDPPRLVKNPAAKPARRRQRVGAYDSRLAYLAGVTAARDGRARASNPHYGAEAKAWREGYDYVVKNYRANPVLLDLPDYAAAKDRARRGRLDFLAATKARRLAASLRKRQPRTVRREAAAVKTGKFLVNARNEREAFKLFRPSRAAADALGAEFAAAGYKVTIAPV